MEENKIYKTPIYVRKALNKYYNKNKEDPEFMAKRNEQRREIYNKKKDDPEFKAKRNEKFRENYRKKHPKTNATDLISCV